MPENEEKSRFFSRLLVRTPEGRIFLAFLGVLAWTLSLVLHFLITDRQVACILLNSLAVNTLGGRGPAVGLCLMGGMENHWTLLYNIQLELLNVLFVYSLFLLSINHYVNSPLLTRFRVRAEATAHRYERHIKKYGVPGIILFVAIPLPMTGPVLGSMIAHFLGFKPAKTLLCVIPGCIIAVFLWVAFFDVLSRNQFVFQAAMAAVLVVTLIMAGRAILVFFKAA